MGNAQEDAVNRPAIAAFTASAAAASACGAPPQAEISSPPPDDAQTLNPAPDVTSTTASRSIPSTTVTIQSAVVPQSASTFTLPEDEGRDQTDAEWFRSQPGYNEENDRALLLACIRAYEQGEDGYATDTGNGYYGAYQFDLPTWQSVGGTGNPAHASPAEQDARAAMLIDRRGLAPWPTPNRRCA